MRFLFIEHHPVFGGPHNQVLRLHGALAQHEWKTLTLLPSEPGSAAERLSAAGIDVLTLPLHRLRKTLDVRTHLDMAARMPSEIRGIRRIIRERRVDLVVLAGVENPHGALAAAAEGVPLVWQINGTQTPPVFRRLIMPLVGRLASVVMTTGTTIADQYPGVRELGERWVPFFAPVDVTAFSPDRERRASARAELGLDPEGPVIGSVGNLNPQKGHLTFLDAAAELKRTHSSAQFVILGASHDTHHDYEQRLWRHASELGLERGRDLFAVAPGSRVADLAPAFDIYWSSSVPRSEGVSTSMSEAMALGIPAVATDVGGTRDMVMDHLNGFLVQPFASRAMAERTRLLLDDPELSLRLGRTARETVVNKCSVEVTTHTHIDAFERALSFGGGR